MLVEVVSENDSDNAVCTHLSAAIEPRSEEPWEEGSIRTVWRRDPSGKEGPPYPVTTVSFKRTNFNTVASHIHFDHTTSSSCNSLTLTPNV